MEIFLGIAVIIMLLLCLGAELGLIAMIFVGVLCGAVLLMLGFFVFSAVRTNRNAEFFSFFSYITRIPEIYRPVGKDGTHQIDIPVRK